MKVIDRHLILWAYYLLLWRPWRNKKIGLQRSTRYYGVFIQAGDARREQYLIIDEEIARTLSTVSGENGMSGIGHNLRLSTALHGSFATKQILDGGRSDGGAGPKCIDRDAPLAKLFGHS